MTKPLEPTKFGMQLNGIDVEIECDQFGCGVELKSGGLEYMGACVFLLPFFAIVRRIGLIIRLWTSKTPGE